MTEKEELERSFPYLFERRDKKPFRIAVLLSLIVHILLFLIVFPEGKTKIYRPRTPKIVGVRPLKFLKPPNPPKKGIPVRAKKKGKKIPIPDPTPDEPEPYVPLNALDYNPTLESDLNYEFGIPNAPEGQGKSGFYGAYPVGGNITPPVLIRKVMPHYPDKARKARIGFDQEIEVILEAVIDTDGKAKYFRVLYTPIKNMGFEEEAIKAVKQWLFKPGTKDGKPVPVYLSVIVTFRLL